MSHVRQEPNPTAGTRARPPRDDAIRRKGCGPADTGPRRRDLAVAQISDDQIKGIRSSEASYVITFRHASLG